jgi:hypothetical protein
MILSKVCNKSAEVRRNCTPVGVLVRDEACSDSDWVKALAAIDGFEMLMRSARAAVVAIEEFEGLREEVECEGSDLDRLAKKAERTAEEAKEEDGE